MSEKFKTRDHVVFYRNKPIPPFTEVKVPDEDVPLWEELVEQHYADRVGEGGQEEPPLEEEKEPASPKRKSKSS